jgi:FkbM family methyltransferase
MSVIFEDVTYAYRYLLGREPAPGEVELWLGYPDLATLREHFENSPEARRPSQAQQVALSEVRSVDANLIFDIGMSEGNDTEFYLRKGFRVIGVEADPIVHRQLEVRFADPIREGRLIVLNRLAGADDGVARDFWRNEVHQGLSSARRHDAPGYAERQTRYDVLSINWAGLTSIAGIPHYCKIDIKGAERDLLRSVGAISPLPNYISAEAHNFSPIENLFLLGYRKFKIIDQNILHSFLPMPNPPLEGLFVESPNWNHASGPFGQELLGDFWLDFQEVTDLFRTLMRLRSYRTVSWTWFDVHAWSDGCECG